MLKALKLYGKVQLLPDNMITMCYTIDIYGYTYTQMFDQLPVSALYCNSLYFKNLVQYSIGGSVIFSSTKKSHYQRRS